MAVEDGSIQGWMRELDKGAESRSLSIDRGACESAARYLDLLWRWGKRMDLTAAMSRSRLAVRFFLEAVPARDLLAEEGCGATDVGSGAGFPGIALAILIPDLRFQLLEPRVKRSSFLRAVCRELPLSNVVVQRTRLEGWSGLHETRNVVARGVRLDDLRLPETEFLRDRGSIGRVFLWTARGGCPSFPGFRQLGQRRLEIPGEKRSEVIVTSLTRAPVVE